MKFVIFGAPGAGKGTIASRLAIKMNIVHIAIGQMFRDIAKSGTEEGDKIGKLLASGIPIPDDIAINAIVGHIIKPEFERGFIFDSPYNVDQSKAIDNVIELDGAINLAVSEEVIVDRLSTRRVCSVCGETYNIRTMPPKVEGKCDKCNSELTQRSDDTPEAIKSRLEHYYKRARPLEDYYEKTGKIIKVKITDGDAPPEVNVQKVLDAIKEKLSK